MTRTLIAVVLAAGFFTGGVLAEDAVELLARSKPNFGWTFDNGQEFPGATGRLSIDQTVTHDGKPSLKLHGDFSKGGNYVQMMGVVPDIDVGELSFWLKAPGVDRLTTRIVDAGKKCHQIDFRIHQTDEWQLVRFPLAEFFKRMGTTNAVTSVARYERWGGTRGALWTGPAKSLCILMGRGNCDPETKAGAIWVSEVRVKPKAVLASEGLRHTIRLDEFWQDGEVDWQLNLGWEFKGAQAALSIVEDQPEEGKCALRLAADFSKGGAYVGAEKPLDSLEIQRVDCFRLRLRSQNVKSYTVRLVDGSGQCFQKKRRTLSTDGKWHEVVVRPEEFSGSEHWGGAKDGKWHPPCRRFCLLIGANPGPDGKQPVLDLADARAEVVLPAVLSPSAYYEGFEEMDQRPNSWATEGRAFVDTRGAHKGSKALCLERGPDKIEDATSAVSPAFKAMPGAWEVSCAARSSLHSPDNSYNGMVYLECLDTAGKVIERDGVAHQFGERKWETFSKRIDAPKGTVAARFRAQLSKTHGTFHVDELSAAHVAAATPLEKRIDRVLLSTDRLGNMLFPEDEPIVHVTIEAFKPLPRSQRTVSYVVRDYWGAEQCERREAVAEKAGKSKSGRFLYKTSLHLGDVSLEIGKYYEVHTEIEVPGGDPYVEYTALVRLPRAEAKKHEPQEIPFTSRNWDNRIKDYFFLTDRIGVRVCGIWGGWSAKPPYKTHAPSIQFCKELKMGVLTGTPAAVIERHGKGYQDYTGEALREGARNFVQQYKKDGLLFVCLGNEPHGDLERAKENTRAYRAIYEEIKKTDRGMFVIGTSVGPAEDYFKAGFQSYLDAYNFHTYSSWPSVPNAFRRYQELIAKYGGEKPIFSTELGLNSQGMTRHTVAVDLIKKLTLFFACGGQNCSWFTIMYPDSKGKARGTFGDAHCVFDCRYNLYSPRLDAVAYYNMVNGICIKKFVAEREYEDGTRAFLFKDKEGRCLQVLWRDKGRGEVSVPLEGAEHARMIRIDGSQAKLSTGGKGVTLTISDDPLLLLYSAPRAVVLPEKLAPPALVLASMPDAVPKGGSTSFTVSGQDLSPDDLHIIVPPFWAASKKVDGEGRVKGGLTAPAETSAREARSLIQLREGDMLRGELAVPVSVKAVD